MLEAVSAANCEFTMVELGAGYGRWSVAAACAVRYRKPMPVRLIAIEAEPSHFQMLNQHFRDNDLDAGDHVLVEGAVNGDGRDVHFVVGSAEAWWGQAIVPAGYKDSQFDSTTVKIRGISLAALLADVPFVDLIDMDIQGAEGEVIEASAEFLTERVRRLHIGTHSHELEESIKRVLTTAGWQCLSACPCLTEVETEFGRVQFGDGVQSWLNPRLI